MASRISTLVKMRQIAYGARRRILYSYHSLPCVDIQRRLVHTLPEQGQMFRQFDLQGKVFAVTGGARGLGLVMAEALADAGGEGISSTISLREGR